MEPTSRDRRGALLVVAGVVLFGIVLLSRIFGGPVLGFFDNFLFPIVLVAVGRTMVRRSRRPPILTIPEQKRPPRAPRPSRPEPAPRVERPSRVEPTPRVEPAPAPRVEPTPAPPPPVGRPATPAPQPRSARPVHPVPTPPARQQPVSSEEMIAEAKRRLSERRR
jgi:hypothetical protein